MDGVQPTRGGAEERRPGLHRRRLHSVGR